jgi:hypothetical protein
VRIERGTGFLIGKVFEASALFFCLSEQTRRRIAREVARQPRDGITSTLPDSSRAFGVLHRKFCQASPQASGIELINGEHTNAARRTSLSANKPTFALARRIRECGIEDLNQFLIARGWKTKRHTDEDTSSRNVSRKCALIINRYHGIFELD